jgi:multiple sugar transport system substrate-binding protein
MFNNTNSWRALIAGMAAVAILSGCGSESPAPGKGDASPNGDSSAPKPYAGGPVELLIKDVNTAIATELDVQNVIARALKAKYPDITFRIVKDSIEDMIASGSPPDIVALSQGQLANYKSLDIPDDLRTMIKTLNLDLTPIEPTVMDAIRSFGTNGELYGLPFGMNHGALIYDKDIFDKFGVPYPKDSLTWEEVVDLNRRYLTRNEGGIQYVGAATSAFVNMFRQYGLSTVDEKNEKAVLTTDGFQRVFGLLQQLFQVPGYVQNNKYSYVSADFYREQTLAMQANWIAAIANDIKSYKPSFAWELSTFPAFKDRPGVGNPVDFHMMAVSKTSKHKDAAMRMLETLVSKETQLAISKAGRLTILADPQVKVTFAQDSGIFTGKNLQSIFKVSSAPLVRSDFSQYKDVISPSINDAVKSIALNQADMNTALRQAEEKANQAVNNMKASQK